jgi:EAL domain-containing protein (putative c-di-GMP-specific phosphodiesterase class I)
VFGQVSALREMGCTLMQGFLWSRPLPYEQLVQWLAQRRAGLISKIVPSERR